MGDKPIFTRSKSKMNPLRLGVIILTLLFAAGITYVIVMAYIDSRKPGGGQIAKLGEVVTAVSNPGEVAFKDKDDMVILCAGLDINRDEKGIMHHKGSRTDTIFLLHIDKSGKHMGMLSTPRDTYVKISDKYGYDKINSAYSLGFLEAYEKSRNNYEAGKAGGIKQAKDTIEKFLGVKIDHYVLIKVEGASELVDALGGLEIDVEKDMDYDDNWGNLHIHLKKGRQKLDGKQAVGYARFRHDEEGDWGRIRRQQQVMNALIREFRDPNNIVKINQIADVIRRNTDTDMSLGTMVDIANVYKGFDKDNLAKGTLTGADDVTSGGAMIIVPDEAEKERLVKRILKDPANLKPDQLAIQILNGSGVQGLAATVANAMKSKGFNVVDVGNLEDSKKEVAETTVTDYYGNETGLAFLENQIGKKIEKITRKPNKKDEKFDFTIILGKDFPTPTPAGTASPGEGTSLPPLEPSETPKDDQESPAQINPKDSGM
ncbi:MAG: LCP family protein [Firmicutes bacterium]|nr:LCP family protein [Bacillota bacterium]